jgi:hypothetical protein
VREGGGGGGGKEKGNKGDGRKGLRDSECVELASSHLISSHLISSPESDQHCTCFDSEVHGVPPSQSLLCLHVHHYAFGRELRLDTMVVDMREGERGRWT